MEKPPIVHGEWQSEPCNPDSSAGGRAAAREHDDSVPEGGEMRTRRRTAGRFQIEALETRWTPGGAGGGVVMVSGAACHIGEEIPQVQVSPLGGASGGVLPQGGLSGGVLGDAR